MNPRLEKIKKHIETHRTFYMAASVIGSSVAIIVGVSRQTASYTAYLKEATIRENCTHAWLVHEMFPKVMADFLVGDEVPES